MAMLALWVLRFRNAKSPFAFARLGNREVIEVNSGRYAFSSTVPFTYIAGFFLKEYKRGVSKISVRVLYIYITNNEGQTAVLSSSLTARDQPPPAWPPLGEILKPRNMRFFNEVV